MTMLAPVLTLRSSGRRTLVQQALAILAKYGSAANLYLPGVGAINGITAGNWLDSVGTTAATVDNPVGLVVGAGKAVGPERVTNGDFTNGLTGWAIGASITGATVTGGALQFTGAGAIIATNANWVSSVVFDAEDTKRYQVEFEAAWVSGGNLEVGSGFSIRLTVTPNAGKTRYSFITPRGGPGGADYRQRISFGAALGATWKIDNISVKELPGAHLTQSTTANKPILRRGLVNLFLRSNDLSAAEWAKIGSTSATSPTTVSLPNYNQSIYQAYSVSAQPGDKFSSSFLLSGVGTIYIFVARNTGGAYEETKTKITLTPTPTLYTVTHTLLAAQTSMLAGVSRASDGTATEVTCDMAGSFTGTVTAQQIIEAGGIPLTTTAPASSTSGAFAWQFDGSNDGFASTLTPGNAGFFCAAANVTDSGVLRTLLGAGGGSVAGAGVWLIRDIVAGGELRLYVGDGTTRQNVRSSAPYPVATTAVSSAGWDGSAMFVGINGTETSVAKTVNCTSSNTMNIGILTGTVAPMLGTIGATIIMPTVLPTASERSILRQLIASLSGVAL